MRRHLAVLAAWASIVAVLVAVSPGAGAQATVRPAAVLTVDGGGTITLDAGDLAIHEVVHDTSGRFIEVELHQPRSVTRGLHMRMTDSGDYLGLPLYFGLVTFVDPATDTRRAGRMVAVELSVADGQHAFRAAVVDHTTHTVVPFDLVVDTPAPPACGSGGDTTPGTAERTFTTTGGDDRTYLFTMPTGYTEGVVTDVVFNFHGLGSNANQQHPYADFGPRAERDTVILVTPNGQPFGTGSGRFWDLGTTTPNVDVDFVYELIDELRADYCLGRLFATGMSMGGGMTTVLACRADSPFEAFVPVTLTFYNAAGCASAPARPIIEFHGTDDGIVGYGPIPAAMQAWADHNGCDPAPIDEVITAQVGRRYWANCDATTELYTINGGGHAWPGSPFAPPTDVSATEIAWTLFGL